MATCASIERNNKRKKMAKSCSKKRQELKSKIMNKELSLEDRFALTIKLAKMPRNSARNRIRNRCALTGRPRGYHRKMGVSRNVLRDLGAKGWLPGVVKSSW